MTGVQLRRLLVPALTTLAMLVVLLVLGTWQAQRLVWKQRLIAAIAAAERAPPVPLGPSPAPLARVQTQGRFLPIAALYGAELRPSAGTPTDGARLLGVLSRPGEPPLLVDRGWVPVPIPVLPPPPTVISGYIRPAEAAGWFTPAPNLVAKRFYALDPATIGPALGIPDLAPHILVVLAGPAQSNPAQSNPAQPNPAEPGAGLPDPARSLPRPTNNHLAYAITWYGLAIALLAIFALHARKVLRS